MVTAAFAQQGPYKITGHILSADGDVLPNTYIIFEGDKVLICDDHGDFTISGLAKGHYELQFFYIGYDTLFTSVTIDQKDVHLDIKMQEDQIALGEVIIVGDHFHTGRMEQSQTIATIDKDFIKMQNAGTLISSLQKLPGISAINTGVGIAKPVIRGMSFNRVLVMDKGIKQEGQQWGADHGLEIDQYDPERVEIIKGPSSLLYGSDAMGGVLRILPPAIPANDSFSGDAFFTYKSNNQLAGGSLGMYGAKNGKFFRGRLSYQDFGDFQVPASSFQYNGYDLPIYNEHLKNTAGDELDFSLAAGSHGDKGSTTITFSSFNQKSGLFPGATGVPREYQLEDDGDSRNIDLPKQIVNHIKLISNTTLVLGTNWMEIDLGYQYNKRQELGAPHAHGYQPTPEGDLALGLDLQTYSGNISYNARMNEKLYGIFGLQGQYQQNKRSGYEFLLADFTAYNAGAFAYQEYSPNHKFSINTGIRYDLGRRNIEEYTEPDYTTPEPEDSIMRNPAIQRNFQDFSAALGFSYYPTINFNSKLNLGTSFRMPTPAELSANGVHHGTFRHEKGDPNLHSERGLQGDLNLTWKQKSYFFLITPFLGYFNNYIYLAPQPYFSDLPAGGQLYQYTQNDAIFTGLEMEFNWDFIKNWNMNSGIEYVWNENLDSGLGLPFTPPFSIFTELKYSRSPLSGKINNYFILGNYHFFAAQNRVDRNERTTPGYYLVSLSAGMEVQALHRNIEFRLSGQNLLNVYYLNHLSRYRLLNLPEQGRNIVISLMVPF